MIVVQYKSLKLRKVIFINVTLAQLKNE